MCVCSEPRILNQTPRGSWTQNWKNLLNAEPCPLAQSRERGGRGAAGRALWLRAEKGEAEGLRAWHCRHGQCALGSLTHPSPPKATPGRQKTVDRAQPGRKLK